MNKLEEIGNNSRIKTDMETLLRVLNKVEAKLQSKSPFVTSTNLTTSQNDTKVTDELTQKINEIFGLNPNQNSTKPTVHNSTNSNIQMPRNEGTGRAVISPELKSAPDKTICGLIDPRIGIPKNCEQIMSPKRKIKNRKRKHKRPLFDVRLGESASEDDDYLEEDEIERNEERDTTTAATTTSVQDETTQELFIWT